MPISVIGPKTTNNTKASRRARQRGVTLVELLVVLAIIAMVASVVVLNAPPPKSDVQDASEMLAARVDFAAAEAVTAGVTIGLDVTSGGYRFLKYDRGEWTEITDSKFRPYTFPEGFAIEFVVEEAAKKNKKDERSEGDEKRPEPAIRFSPTGETTPFQAVFRGRRGAAVVALDGVGEVTISTGGENE